MAKEKDKEQKNKDNSEIGYIKPRDINQEMEESYLDYAMSVIVSRALPDVRDGLKPVHRRILYAMNNLGLRAGAKFRKSATVVGEVLGKYHPHGDVAVYDSLVRLAQDFAMRYPLINGQGNFGSMDGDSAAAMRYTEAKMASIAEELLADIDKETINFVPNYDDTQKEPAVLPARIPNLLINGTMGIAVGMSTNIPPHNLSEVIDATIHLIDNPEATVEDLLLFVKGPDFPTGGVIYDIKEISQAYGTGKGGIVMRAVSEIVEDKKGQKIVISELPYQINKATLVTRIAELIKNKKIQGITDLRDESSRGGVQIILDLKKEAYPKKILNQLYKTTPMQTVFYVNTLALVDGIQPRVLTLKMVLEEYIKHRREVVTRRCEYDLKKAKERAHILEGLLIALKQINEVITTIKKSATREEAHKNLAKKFRLTDIQATAILEMRLQTLAGLERKKIEDEYKKLKKLIAELTDILAHPKKILNIIKKELLEIKEKYGDERKTKVIKSSLGQFTEEDLVPNEEVIITLTRGNYIKRTKTTIYKAQRRGGKGVMGMATKEEDIVEQLIKTMTHDNMLFFTNQGRVFQLKVYDIPPASRIAKGQAIVNLLNIAPGEKVTTIVNMPASLTKENNSGEYLLMITKKGTVKKTAIKQFLSVRKSGLTCIKLDKGDELKWVRVTSGKDEIVMGTSLGQAIRFKEQDVRPMGRSARGVRGIRLRSGDEVVGADTIKPKSELLVIMENGYGKRTGLFQFTLHRRGGVGIKTALITSKTGKVVDVRVIESAKGDLIVISEKGQLIRMPIVSVSKIGRATQGVRIMRLNEKDLISSVAYLGKSESIDSE